MWLLMYVVMVRYNWVVVLELVWHESEVDSQDQPTSAVVSSLKESHSYFVVDRQLWQVSLYVLI